MFRSQTNNKIGNLLNYLATRIPNLSLTKTLKLLYLIDETAYTRTGVSITWFDYKVWKNGPVAEELYNELKYDQSLVQNGEKINLEPFIETQKTDKGEQSFVFILPRGKFDLSAFSSFETELIDNIIDRFGTYTASQLIELLHEKDTLWHKSVINNNLSLNFKVYGSKSNHTIDFSELIKEDPIKQMAAQSAFESMQLQEDLETL